MTASTRKTAGLAALGLGLAGGSLLATPALAMNDLVQGYALAASALPTAQSTPTPPPADVHAEGKRGADHKQAEGSCGADSKHAEGKCGSTAGQATAASAADGQAAADKPVQADKGMEGKCGEGKCGGSP